MTIADVLHRCRLSEGNDNVAGEHFTLRPLRRRSVVALVLPLREHAVRSGVAACRRALRRCSRGVSPPRRLLRAAFPVPLSPVPYYSVCTDGCGRVVTVVVSWSPHLLCDVLAMKIVAICTRGGPHA